LIFKSSSSFSYLFFLKVPRNPLSLSLSCSSESEDINYGKVSNKALSPSPLSKGENRM
jgi:hypothetical protein